MNTSLLKKSKLMITAIICCAHFGFAQEAEFVKEQGTAMSRVVIDFKAVALTNALNKSPKKPIEFIGNKKAREIKEVMPSLLGRTVFVDPHKEETNVNRTFAPNPSPSPLYNFNALNDDARFIPPDVNGAVGPNHLMTTLNSQVRIQDRQGNVISTVDLSAFWAPIGGLGQVYDPKVLYDHQANRWMIVTSANPQLNTSCTLLGVSQTNDPTGSWNLYKVDVDPTNTMWVDYPSIGFNDKWIVVQMNLFPMSGSSATSHQIYVWDKDDVYANGTGVYTLFKITNESTAVVCPSIHYDNSVSKMFVIRTISGTNGGRGSIGMRTISGPKASPSLSTETVIQTALGVTWTSSGNNNGDFAPQLGTTNKVATNDHRMRQVVVRDGKVWAVHTVFLPAGTPTRSSVQYWQLDTVGAVLQRGRIDDPTGTNFYSFPSIAVNNKNDVLIGYASFAANRYPSGSYSFRRNNDPINTFRDEYIFKYGENTYFKNFGSTRNRWGDYTNTVVDPTNDSVFWTIQEYSGSGSNQWATWWAAVDADAQVPDFSADKIYTCVGQPVSFTNTSNFSGSNISWTFTGGNPATSTDPNPSVVYNTSGRYRVTLTVDGKVQQKDAYINVTNAPNKIINKGAGTPCEGKAIALTAAQAGAKYLWSNGATTRTINVTQSGTYSCEITSANGLCTITSDSVTLNFAPAPTVTFASLATVTNTTPAFALTGGAPAGGTYTGTGVANGNFDPAIAGVGSHIITYSFTNNEGCVGTDTSSIIVTNAVGINNEARLNYFDITPNPSKGLLKLNVVSTNSNELKLQVIDQLGKIILEKEYVGTNKKVSEELNLSSLPKGVYFIRAEMGDASETKKVVIE